VGTPSIAEKVVRMSENQISVRNAYSKVKRGYNGKILTVNLTDKSFVVTEPHEHYWRTFAGGGLLAAERLLRETPAGADPLGPDNALIFASSVMAGQPYVGLASLAVCAKSPLTHGMGETHVEGPFSASFKESGFDVIVIKGKSARPVLLEINQGKVAFVDGDEYWGKNVDAAVDALESKYGQGISTAVIGTAGENLVRFASIVTNRSFQASRMGMGAVMGSKNLKALVIAKGERPPVADPAKAQELTDLYASRIPSNPLSDWQFQPPGFAAWVHTHGLDAALCTKNFRESAFPGVENFTPEEFMSRFKGNASCPGCPNDCFKSFTPESMADKPGLSKASAMHQEIMASMGANIGNADLDFLFESNILCNTLGMDPTSLGYVISMAIECLENGVVVPEIAPSLTWGDTAGIRQLILDIAARKGAGNLLAEGVKVTSEKLGPKSTHYAMHIKGLEMCVAEPRTQTNLALGYATAPIGPRYNICEHDWDYDTELGWPHTMQGSNTLVILERIPMDYLGPKKVRNYRALSQIWSATDALCLCIFAAPPTRSMTLEEMGSMLSAITGWESSSYEVMEYGERRINLTKIYNIREGITADQDTLPERFFTDPITVGRWSNYFIDKGKFQEMIQTYYAMMGWNEAGIPRYSTLLSSRLEWVVDEGHLPLVIASSAPADDK
jgi:aldehyde:ferredoxin oxidoreductase